MYVGGGVGHLADDVLGDPIMKQRSEVAVITGSNDYVGAKYDSHNDFVFTVDKSVEKLKVVLAGVPDKASTILYPQDDAAEEWGGGHHGQQWLCKG